MLQTYLRQPARLGLAAALTAGLLLTAFNLTAAESVAPEAPAAADAKAAPRTFYGKVADIFDRGGSVMWVLVAVSVVGLTFALERAVSLRRGVHLPLGLLEQTQRRLKREGPEAARRALAASDAALAKVLSGLLARRGAPRQELERVLEDEAGRVLWDLRRNIRPVGVVASLAPLIGLQGTVLGMISAFQEAAAKGMDNPANFAEGIYLALYTTAGGLAVAIPALVVHHLLRGQADAVMREVEDQAVRFIIELDALPLVEAEVCAAFAEPLPGEALPEGEDLRKSA